MSTDDVPPSVGVPKMHQSLIAACAGSVVTSLVVNPFDVVRVRMQQSSAVEHISTPVDTTFKPPKSVGSTNEQVVKRLTPYMLSPRGSLDGLNASLGVTQCCKDVFWYPSTINYCISSERRDTCLVEEASEALAKKPKGTFGVLRSIMRDEGASVLWRGTSLQFVQAIPSNVVYFVAYEHLRDTLTSSSLFTSWAPQAAAPFVSGGLARSMASTMVAPLELLKTRLQSIQVATGQSAMQVALRSVKEMLAVDGPRSLFSGLGITLWRDIPFSSIYWLVLETVRGAFPKSLKYRHSHSEKFIESFASGIIGGVVASVLTTPFDVAKTRRQLAHPSCGSAHMNMLTFMSSIAKKEGFTALLVGIGPRTMKVAPACAIMITSYEMGKRLLS